MKTIKTLLIFSGLMLSVHAEEPAASNRVDVLPQETPPARTNDWKSKHDRSKRMKPEEYQLRLMERELDNIGISEEEKAQIQELQKKYREKMVESYRKLRDARERLTALLDEGATMEEIDAAIMDVSAAQTEQLRNLVMNRLELERILGKEKHDEFMKNARSQYKKHGRRGGPPLPPRPNHPPTPEESDSPPPAPPAPPEEE